MTLDFFRSLAMDSKLQIVSIISCLPRICRSIGRSRIFLANTSNRVLSESAGDGIAFRVFGTINPFGILPHCGLDMSKSVVFNGGFAIRNRLHGDCIGAAVAFCDCQAVWHKMVILRMFGLWCDWWGWPNVMWHGTVRKNMNNASNLRPLIVKVTRAGDLRNTKMSVQILISMNVSLVCSQSDCKSTPKMWVNKITDLTSQRHLIRQFSWTSTNQLKLNRIDNLYLYSECPAQRPLVSI